MSAPITFIRFPEVKRRTALPKSVLYRRMATGLFPKSVSLAGRSRAWREDVIEGYNQLIASSAPNDVVAAYCKSVEPHFNVRLSGERRVRVTALERIRA